MSSPTSQRVPFLLRSGRALGSARQDILIHFKEVPHLPTGLTRGPPPRACAPAPPRASVLRAEFAVQEPLNDSRGHHHGRAACHSATPERRKGRRLL